MSKLYQYTLYKQDGTTEDLGVSRKKDFAELYQLLNCDMIEIIPSDYYAGRLWGNCTVYGDEEGRLKNTNHHNPHFNVLDFGYDVVGNCIKEKTHKE